MSAELQAEKARLEQELDALRGDLRSLTTMSDAEREAKKARAVEIMRRLPVVNKALFDAGLLG